jgi:hypothetical protein
MADVFPPAADVEQGVYRSAQAQRRRLSGLRIAHGCVASSGRGQRCATLRILSVRSAMTQLRRGMTA